MGNKLFNGCSLEKRIHHDCVRSNWIGTWKQSLASLSLTMSVVATIVTIQVVSYKIKAPFYLDDIVGFLAIAVSSQSLGILGHETYHDSFFVKKRTNDLFGRWVFHYPLLGRFDTLRDLHMQHHRFFGSEFDPDRDHWDWKAGDRNHRRQILKVSLGLSFTESVYTAIKSLLKNRDDVGNEQQSKRDISGVLLTQFLIFLLFYVFGSWKHYLFLYITPIVTIGTLIEHLRVFCEHNEGALRVFTRPSRIGLVIFGRANFRMHALHHQAPSTPWFALGSKYSSVNSRVSKQIVLTSNYLSELRKIIK